MRLIMYHPRFPTHNTVPPELDALPPSTQQSPQSIATPMSHHTSSNGLGTAHSTIYRVSASGGIRAHHGRPSTTPHSNGTKAENDGRGYKTQGDNERSATPTQSNTLTQAKKDAANLDRNDFSSLTSEQLEKLQQDMWGDIHDSDSRPLVSSVQSMDILMHEYSSNPNFLRKMQWLKKEGWLGVRRTKGDGDCFYRSFAFAWVERILRAKDRELSTAAAISTLHTTWLGVQEAGFEAIVVEDFYDVIRSLVRQVIEPEPNGKMLNASILLEAFTNPEASNSIVSYMRILTSAELQRNADEYAAFVVHPETQESMPVVDFCHQFVEGMGKEADHVQMQALAKALGVNLSVAYLDGSDKEDDSVDFVKFENGGGMEANGIEDVVLLYRPGHYDILEHRASEYGRSTASALVNPSVME